MIALEKDKNKLCMYSWFGYELPLEQRLRYIREAGFDATMIWWGDQMAYRDGNKAETMDIVLDSGLYLDNIHLPFENVNSIWSADLKEGVKILDSFYEWMEDCAEYNVPIAVMHITKGYDIKEPNINGIECIGKIVERAKQNGVKIAIENTRNPAIVDFVLDEIDSPWLGFCYDSSHDWLYSDAKGEQLKRNGKRLLVTHFSDNDGLKDRHWLPKTGVVDWQKIISTFPKGYSGSISLEIVSAHDGRSISAREFLSKAFECALWIRSGIEKRFDNEK